MVQTNFNPELRFPEFKSDWKKPKLEEKMDVFRGASPRPKGDPKYYGGNIPRLMIEDVTRDGKYAYPKIDFLTEEGSKKSRFLKKGSVVLSCSGTRVAIPGILGVDACIHDGWISFKNFKEVDSEFLYNIFVKLHERMQGKATTGGVFNNLTTSIIRDLRFGFPSLLEQQKIAAFLTAVDKRIQLLQKKKAKLEDYKKGVMQKLFSQDIRFKDENDNDFPDWEEKKLGNVFSSQKGTGLSKKALDPEGRFECILYGELYTTYAEVIFDVISKTDEEGGTLSNQGDLLVPCSTTTSAIDLANVTALNRDNVRLGGDITILRAGKNVDNIFYAYYLSNYKKIQIAKFGQGTTIVHLYYNHFKVMTIDVPSLDEQNKIAAFLTSLDSQLVKCEQLISESELFKKGLLQKMFV